MLFKREEWLAQSKDRSSMEQDLLARCYDTLMNNIFEADKYPWGAYRCISPGINHFCGIWNWDSAFHAIGVSRWDTQLAKEGILGFLQFQRPSGILPDVIWTDGEIVDHYSKPPVFAWAVETLYRREKDIEFIAEVYPKLVLNESYWVATRCYSGLFFYDSERKNDRDYDLHVRYESGWDNSVRWDTPINDFWAIDLNCFMVMFYRSLEFLAQELTFTEDAAKWKQKEEELIARINEKLWNREERFYSDVNRFNEQASKVLSPASFMPLFINIADDKRAARMAEVAASKELFNSHMPTVSYNNPEFSTDYWRGPVWLNVAYFAAKGLKNYGFGVADVIKQNILEMCDKEKRGIFENYDSITGEGLCNDRFSWSCVFIMEFILNF